MGDAGVPFKFPRLGVLHPPQLSHPSARHRGRGPPLGSWPISTARPADCLGCLTKETVLACCCCLSVFFLHELLLLLCLINAHILHCSNSPLETHQRLGAEPQKTRLVSKSQSAAVQQLRLLKCKLGKKQRGAGGASSVGRGSSRQLTLSSENCIQGGSLPGGSVPHGSPAGAGAGLCKRPSRAN